MNRIFISLAFLALAACGGDSGEPGDECVEGEFACSETVLQECVGGVLTDVEDCAEGGEECMADMGHCGNTTTMTEDTGMAM